MADKVTLINLSKVDSTITNDLNTNFTRLADAIDDALDRTGASPNQLEDDVDANDFQIKNLGKPSLQNHALRLKDVPGSTDAVVVNLDSYTDLKDINHNSLDNEEIRYVGGRSSVGDGGEGHFRWDSSDLSTEVGNDEVTTGEGDGGIYVAPDSDKTGASGAWVRQHGGSVFYVTWYGAKGDGTANDWAACQIAMNAASTAVSAELESAKLIFNPGHTFKINSPITVGADRITVEAYGAVIDATEITGDQAQNDPDSVIEATGNERGTVNVSSDIPESSLTVDVSSTSGLLPGDPVRIYSDGESWYTENGNTVLRTTINRIETISGSTLTLHWPIPYSFDATSHTVTVEAWDVVEDFHVRGGSWYGGGLRETLSNGKGPGAVKIEYFDNVSVEDMYCQGFQNTAIRFEHGISPLVRNVTIRGHEEDFDSSNIVEGENSGFYGVFFVKCRGGLLASSVGYRCRHFQDAADAEDIRVVGCHTYNSHKAGYTCHRGATNIIYDGCMNASTQTGLLWRGHDLTVTGCVFLGPNGNTTGILDATGLASDVPRNYVITNNRIDVERKALDLQAHMRSALIEGNSLTGAHDNLYPVVRLASLDIDSVLIRGNDITSAGNGNQAIFAPSNSPRKRSLILVEGNRIAGYTSEALRVNDTGSVGVVLVRGNYFDVSSFSGSDHVATGGDEVLASLGPNYLSDGDIFGTNLVGVTKVAPSSVSGVTYRNAATGIFERDGNNEVQILSPSTAYGQVRFGDENSDFRGAVTYDHSADDMDLVAAGATRLTLDSNTGSTGGTGSAGSGSQYVELQIGGNRYKLLHDGTL